MCYFILNRTLFLIGDDNLNKGVGILLSHSSLEERLKEPLDLANKSQDILGKIFLDGFSMLIWEIF